MRKGKMRGYVSKVIEPEDYAKMSNEELFGLIRQELSVDEAVADACFRSNKRAEYLERAMYVCPFCGLTTFESHGNEVTCKTCGRTVTYGEDKSLKGVGFEFPFPFVKQWYQHQQDVVNGLDVTAYTEEPLYTDRVDLSEVVVYKNKKPLAQNVTVKLYGDKIIMEGREESFSFDEINAITVLGKNKLNIYCNKHVHQFKGDLRFNALKYVNLWHRYKNMTRGDEQGFLGL